MNLKLTVSAAALVFHAAAAAMPVNVFLTKAEALQAKGIASMFSGDFPLLMNIVKADAAALKSEREAAVAAKRTPAYCPPGPFQMGSDEVIQAMREVPAAARPRTDSRDALRAHLARRFPCRA
jgi:hypothetical protein